MGQASIDGLVTATDVLAAIAGDLVEDEAALPRPLRLPDGSVRLDGGTPIDVTAEMLGLGAVIDGADYANVAGFVTGTLKRIPKVGESFELAGWRFRVEAMDGRRVAAVVAIPLHASAESVLA